MPSKLDKFYARQSKDGEFYIFCPEKWEAIFPFTCGKTDKILHCGNVRAPMCDEILCPKKVWEEHFNHLPINEEDENEPFFSELHDYIYGEKPKFRLSSRTVTIFEVINEKDEVVSDKFFRHSEAEECLKNFLK